MLFAVGTGYSVIVPAVVMRPILLPVPSVNHRLPSGPAVMSRAPPPAVGTGNSVMVTESACAAGARPAVRPTTSPVSRRERRATRCCFIFIFKPRLGAGLAGFLLDGEATLLHQADALRAAGDGRVVGDEDEGQPELAPEFLEQ